VSNVVRMPPRGRYLAWEAGQLAGVSGQTMGQWARRGYIRSSVSTRAPRIYSFQDIAEAMVVHELLDRGVPHRDIKKAIRHLEEQYGDWPLTEAPLATVPGVRRARVVVRQAEADYDVGDKGWQQVIEPEHLEEIRRQLTRGGWAVRSLPELRHIEVDPDRLSGRPTIRGRRIAAQDVAEMASAPGGIDVLREDYELDEEEIADARRWWREVRRLEHAAA
jgi:uncharacterized protein (DUF433 family)/DNA-binding transcriptional MerR regulator